jgi:putative transcriptional regulator
MRLLLILACCLLLALPAAAPAQRVPGTQLRDAYLLAQQQVRSEPIVLVASPELRDPNFAAAVVLVVFPASGGATGVILNRPTTLQWKEAFPDDAQLRKRSDRIYFGGPVTLAALWFMFHDAQPSPQCLPVMDDLYLTNDGALLDRLLSANGAVDRFFLGYAGWAPGQLDFEVAAGAWHILPFERGTMLKMKPETMWRELLGRATAIKA